MGYSLHSNFQELIDFVKSICPGKISTEHRNKSDKKIKKIDLIKDDFVEMNDLRRMEQDGINILIEKYTMTETLSEEYFAIDVI